MNLCPTTFEEYIGNPRVLQSWKTAIECIKPGDILYIYGYSGVGKTSGTLLLAKPFNILLLDTSKCSDSKELLDHIHKFHSWSSLFQDNDKQKLIIIDELETFIKTDRNSLNMLMTYIKQYGKEALPIILIGDTDSSKKLGEIKNYITDSIYLNRLQDADMFLYFKKRLPRNKIKLVDLMKITEDAAGNILIAIKNIEERYLKRKTLLSHYKGDEQKTFNEIFNCRNPDIISKLLLEDTWMHPLKVHENSIGVLDEKIYPAFLKDYILFEQWHNSVEDSSLPIDFLAHILIYFMPEGLKIETMEFSKVLSYISTQKKYKKLYYTFEDLGRNKNIVL